MLCKAVVSVLPDHFIIMSRVLYIEYLILALLHNCSSSGSLIPKTSQINSYE